MSILIKVSVICNSSANAILDVVPSRLSIGNIQPNLLRTRCNLNVVLTRWRYECLTAISELSILSFILFRCTTFSNSKSRLIVVTLNSTPSIGGYYLPSWNLRGCPFADAEGCDRLANVPSFRMVIGRMWLKEGEIE